VFSETNQAERQPMHYYSIRPTTAIVSLPCNVTCALPKVHSH